MRESKVSTKNPYEDNIDIIVSNAQSLVKKKIISQKFADVLVTFLIKRQLKDEIKHYMFHVLGPNSTEKLLMINYEKRKISY